ncbi:MAG: CotH kinase family protein [Ruminococcus sp.]|nr:CotH kinase family protein [Ruminococcus sp.]
MLTRYANTLKRTVSLSLLLLIIFGSIFTFDSFADSVLEVPRITFTTEDGNGVNLKKSDGYINAEVSIEDVDGSTLSDSVTMKVRGNSTAFDSIAKKSYNFKFTKKKNVLNMGSGKKWSLISNVFDPTLARNYVAFSIAKELDIQYTSNFKVVEVVVDGSFRGCYLLVEPIGVNKDRVDIDIESNDGKKDFLVELEKSRNEDDVKYFNSNGLRFAVSEPDSPNNEQVRYAQLTIDDVIYAIRNGTQEEIENKIDVESFVKFYLLNEYLKTVDFGYSSVFFYYKDGKLYAGPPWDYDLSSGNVEKDYSSDYASSYKTDGLYAYKFNFYKWLCEKSWFNDLVKNELREHYNFFDSIYSENGVIDSFYKAYKSVIDRNFDKNCWKVNGYYVNVMKKPLSTYQENYDYYVNWCKERSEWLIDYFDAKPIPNPQYEQLVNESVIPDVTDNNTSYFGLPEDIKYKGMNLLGFQLKPDNNSCARFVSVISSELLNKASDYGYVFSNTDKSVSDAKETADTVTVKNGIKYSCLGTQNTITGEYGNPDSETDYKYVTAVVNDINVDSTLVGRFYAVIDDFTYYAQYTGINGDTYSGCAAKLNDLTIN